MSEPIRTFVAIELDDAHYRALADLQGRFKRDHAARAVRWVAPGNIHLTLKFFGDVDAAAMPAVQRAVADACAGIAPFLLRIAGAGAFPNTQRPNVVWVGISGEIERAALLARKIDDACAALGFAREGRAFSPHLTLGRVQRDASPADRRAIGEMIVNAQVGDMGEWPAKRVSVMKSELKPGGSVYSRMATVELGNQATSQFDNP